MMTLPVHRIIPFSNVEGIGNRTSIFVQGCNANCLYCHNSETIPMTAEGVSQYTIEALLEVIKSSMPFIRGITVSGGEATLYHGFLTELFKEVHGLGLTCYVDTNGFYKAEILKDLIDETDKFLYDVKGIGQGLEKLCFSEALLANDHRAKDYNQRFVKSGEHVKNLEHLLKLDKVEEVRLVYVKGIYDEEAVVDQIAKVLKNYPQVPLKLIKMHARGLPKERLRLLKGNIPKAADYDHIYTYAKHSGIQNIIEIQ